MQVEVRRIARGEGGNLRDVRLRALQESPEAFSSTYEKERSRGPDQWERMAEECAAGRERAMFVADAGGAHVGLVGGFRREPESAAVELVSMWVAPDARRRGVGNKLVDAVVDWAASTGSERVDLWVVHDNNQALALYQRCGFTLTGDVEPYPPDSCKDELKMTRIL